MNYYDEHHSTPMIWQCQSWLLLLKDAVLNLRYAVILALGLDLLNESNGVVRIAGFVIAFLTFAVPMSNCLYTWLNTKFSISDDGLRLRSGYLKKVFQFVPTERLHELHITQTWWLRLMGLYHVEWSVPGSCLNTFVLSGLNRKQVISLNPEYEKSETNTSDVSKIKVLFALTGSHWTFSALLTVYVFLWGVATSTFGDNAYLWAFEHRYQIISETLMLVCGVVFVWVLALWFMTLRMYPQHCQFSLGDVHVTLGTWLQQRRRYPIRKIQKIRIVESWMGDNVTWRNVVIKGSAGDDGEREITLLANTYTQINQKLQNIFGISFGEVRERQWKRPSVMWWPRYFINEILRALLFSFFTAAVMNWLIDVSILDWLLALFIAFALFSWVKYQRKKAWFAYDSDESYVYLRRGGFRKSWELIPWKQVQKATWTTTPHARKTRYKHLSLHLLEEEIDLPGCSIEDAEQLEKHWLLQCK